MRFNRLINIQHWLTYLALFICSISHAQPAPLIIGVAASYPPLSTQADKKSHFFGFEIDLMNEICNRLKITCEYRPIIVSKIMPALATGKLDLAMAAIVRPTAIPSGFIFSLPYLESYGQFMTLKKSTINNLQDIQNKTVGIRLSTTEGGHLFRDLLEQVFHNQVNVVEYTTLDDILIALVNDDVDVLFGNKVAVQYWYQNNMELYKLVGDPITIGNGYAIMSLEKNNPLISQINIIITEMINDGTYKKIYETYFSAGIQHI